MPRTSVTIPAPLLEDIKYISSRLGVTRSAFISEVLGDVVVDLRHLLEQVPEDTTSMSDSDALRLRGESVDIIRSRIQQLKEMDNDLFSDL